jgi:regulator of protease activity HflC (stomatin/prohibitin superfamily)
MIDAPASSALEWPERRTQLVVISAWLFGLFLLSSVRILRRDQRMVVRRFGRVVRVGGPGMTFVVPGLDRAEKISMRARWITPLVVHAVTRDGHRVHVRAAAACRIVDPARATSVQSGADHRMTEAAQIAICQRIAEADLLPLLSRQMAPVQDSPRHHVNHYAEHWGVEVIQTEVSDVTSVRAGSPSSDGG